MEFDRGAVGSLGHPNIQILLLSNFKENGIVTVVEIGQFVQDVEVVLCVEFGVFF